MTNKQEAKVFTFNENNKPVRVELVDGEPWFVAKDVCDALGIEKYRDALGRLEDDEKGCPVTVDTLGGPQKMSAVNESGLYNLIFQSRKPEAKKFRKWVTGEVLPSIRKTGRYEVNGQTGLNGRAGSAAVAVRRGPRRATAAELMTVELMNLLWLIDESLFLGDRKAVAMELGVSRVTVNNVLRGRVRNARVLMALYQKAKENRACGLLYQRPELMSSRLTADESVDDETFMRRALPPVIYGNRKKGGQIGNQNARKHWGKEDK